MPAPDYAPEIAALEAAIATGELRVEQDGEMVIYQSIGQMLTAANYFRDRARQAAQAISAQGSFGFSSPSFTRE